MNTTKAWIWIVAVIALLALAAGMYYSQSDKEPAGLESDTVATVNGVEIQRAEFDRRLAVVMAQAQAQGQPADAAVQGEMVLDQLITEELVLQDAKTRGIVVSQAEVDTQMATIRGEFATEAEYQTALTDNKISAEQLKVNVANELLFAKYVEVIKIEQNLVAPEEAEVRALFDQLTGEQTDGPSFEEVRLQLEQEIVQQKLSEAFLLVVADLKANADIQTAI